MTTNTLPEISTLWKHKDPASSQTSFMSLLPGAEAGDDSPYLVVLLTQIARAQGLQRHYEAANANLDRAKRILDDQPPLEMRTAMVSYLLERGRIYRSSGYEDRAEDYFLEAYELGLDACETAMAIDAAHMLGLTLEGTEAIDWFNRALKHSESGLDALARRWEAPLMELLGRMLAEQGNEAEAKQMFAEASKSRRLHEMTAAAAASEPDASQGSCPEVLTDGSLLIGND